MILIAFLFLLLLSSIVSSKKTQRDTDIFSTKRCTDFYPYELDVGIYWAKYDPITREIEWSKSCLDAISPVFKNSIYESEAGTKIAIFTHGLQPGIINPDMTYIRFGLHANLQPLIIDWIERGWTIGIFYWDQFADEQTLTYERAEAKIYSPTYTSNMRYTYLDDKSEVAVADASIKQSVSDIFAEHYLTHMALLPVPVGDVEIRLIGHSLGTQLVVVTATQLLDMYRNTEKYTDTFKYALSNYMPTRITMLDPVFSANSKGYFEGNSCGSNNLDVIGCYIKDLSIDGGIAVEIYRSSILNKCLGASTNDPVLTDAATFSQVRMMQYGDYPMGSCYDSKLLNVHLGKTQEYLSALAHQIANQHAGIVPYYLLSLMYPPHRCSLSEDRTTCQQSGTGLAPSAAMSTEEIRYWSMSTYNPSGHRMCFHQFDDGTRSLTSPTMTMYTGDDLYYVFDCRTTNN